ncbi:nucleotidyltransferase family protein [Desulfobacterota bacterium AH_259_B03_O07]|nr:nucleotidyltransferase family protein [Desulfobacterota bacterium AH_259_B03_O07]
MALPVAILAGGLAKRLRPLTKSIPKCLVEVAHKPFIEHQLELMQQHGLHRIVLCVGYLGEMVKTVLGDGSRMGMDLRYVFDGKKLLGTGGALRKALPLLGEIFFVLYGDSYLDCNYIAIEKKFLEQRKLGLMTIFRNANKWDRSNILYKDGCLIHYDKENPTPEMQHIDYGLGVLNAKVFDDYPPDTTIDLATIYQDLLTKDELSTFEVTQRFYEIGSPDGLDETHHYLLNRTKEGTP